jgi:hypothetical protein
MSILVNQATLDQTKYLATSDRYNVITTQSIIDRLQLQGFELADYNEARYRDTEKKDKVRHMVRMSIDSTSGLRRDIVIFNSYDSSTSLRLNFGAYREVCMNTLCFGDNLLPEMRIKHTHQNPFDRIDEYSDSIRATLEHEAHIRQKMENTRFSAYDIEQFARRAIDIRESDLSLILDPNDLNTVQRTEDIGKNLWFTFNRMQENLIKGDYRKLGLWTDNQTGESFEKYKKAKELKSPNELIRVNKSLHDLAMSYL